MPLFLLNLIIIIFAFAVAILPAYLVRYLLILENPKIDKKRLRNQIIIGVLFGAAIILWASVISGSENFIGSLFPPSYQDFRDVIIFTLVITLLPAGLIYYLLVLENPIIDKKRLFRRATIGVALAILGIIWAAVIVGFTTLTKWLLPTTFKDFIGLIQSFVALIAIVGGLRWFFKRGKHLPRANISQKLEYSLEEKDKILIMIDITITNPGDAVLSIQTGFIGIYQVKPFTPELKAAIDKGIDASYKELYNYKIELPAPITLEQNITDNHHVQFLMPSKVKNAEGNDVLLEVFQAYTVFYNPYNSDNNWVTTTTHKIEPPAISTQVSKPKGFISRFLSKFRGK